ncbi:hypothetical protein XBKQ1_1940006 [Xenorhabdus bovienii str. kraussei Quebec]|uniref:Condensation domain-containing protein n=1 Tax=Xenorhabdus bovienii str. kraussei Quebec TaxID=1398203 RepID=A0A077PF29_XENBV|nr:hypothetical protein [Xenorhabdus bovienii]CDH19212.1 hypothetical protein XBKQ1_1940006 [Xenorhabdus bovienii str. kraussei Quebec]
MIHLYLELDCVSLPDSVINQAVNKLFQRHDLLRMRINPQGLAMISQLPLAVTNGYIYLMKPVLPSV